MRNYGCVLGFLTLVVLRIAPQDLEGTVHDQASPAQTAARPCFGPKVVAVLCVMVVRLVCSVYSAINPSIKAFEN